MHIYNWCTCSVCGHSWGSLALKTGHEIKIWVPFASYPTLFYFSVFLCFLSDMRHKIAISFFFKLFFSLQMGLCVVLDITSKPSIYVPPGLVC